MAASDYYFDLAIKAASRGDTSRHYLLGAVGIRKDGAIVTACNSKTQKPSRKTHAEYKLSRKLDLGSTVYVARVLKDGSVSSAKPCKNCEKALRTRGVKKVFYTIGPDEFGCLEFS